MTYLELCQAVVDEVGLSGEIITVENRTGDYGRIVRFVRSSCQQIEGRWINWRFLHGSHTFTTTENVAVYPAPEAIRVRQWDINRAYIDQLNIDIMCADDALDYRRDPIAENYVGMPDRLIIERDNSIRTIGIPDREYSIEIEYFRMATVLRVNDDVPAIPEQFQEIIVMDAVRRYSNYDEAPELKQQAIEQVYGVNGTWAQPEPGSWLHQLQADQLPNSFFNGATEGGFFVVRTE